MSSFLEKIIGDLEGKREWKEIKARAKALPEEYRIVYEKIQKYIWNSSGVESLTPFGTLLDMFEAGVANGQSVLQITGEDVAAFVDELVRGEKSYYEKLRRNLNNDIMEKLGRGDESK